jgi:protein-S-isoprenylcysteine O-methyltransferase Ste14
MGVTDAGRVTSHPTGTAARVYSAFAYLAFAVSATWAIAFLADLRTVPVIDRAPSGPAWVAVLVDLGLLLVFALQHFVMARAAVKRRMARVVPAAIERSTYVLSTSLCLGLLFWQWRGLPASIWRVDAQPWVALLWGIYAVGWVIALSSTFMIDHLDFLGLRQGGWARHGPYRSLSFAERWMYAWLRHPMMLGLLVAFWATPSMRTGHLLFALAASGYIVLGVRFEERDLRRQLGDVYREYARRVPRFVPRPPRSVPAALRTETKARLS